MLNWSVVGMQGSKVPIAEIRKQRDALARGRERGVSEKWALRLWSKFIRCRDGGACVSCGNLERVQAHHIVRKVLYPWGALETGNGISLCWGCHRKIHAQFNRRPDLGLPLGAEQGDDQDEWAYLFGLLLDDARSRGLPQDEFYYLGDQMLHLFVRFQGYKELLDAVAKGAMTRIRFAHEIWRPMPEAFYTNFASELLRLNFFPPEDQ
jgi:hypothetical protein